MKKAITFLMGVVVVVGLTIAAPNVQEQAYDPDPPIGGQSIEPIEE